MKLIAFTLAFSFFSLIVCSQGIKPGNIFRVTVTSQYAIEDGKPSSHFFAVNQEVFDSLGRLHTEIDYDPETRLPDNYRWHFYDSMLLVRTEYYVDNKLHRRVVYEYETDTVVGRELHYELSGKDTVHVRTLNYSYDSSGQPVQVDVLAGSGRRLYRVISQHDGRGTEVSRRIRRRRDVPEDGIIRMERLAEYNSMGLPEYKHTSLRFSDRSRLDYIRKFEYDERGNITGITRTDPDGNQIKRTAYVWQVNRGRLSQIMHYDKNDEFVKFLVKRYEIYSSTDRRRRVIDY